MYRCGPYRDFPHHSPAMGSAGAPLFLLCSLRLFYRSHRPAAVAITTNRIRMFPLRCCAPCHPPPSVSLTMAPQKRVLRTPKQNPERGVRVTRVPILAPSLPSTVLPKFPPFLAFFVKLSFERPRRQPQVCLRFQVCHTPCYVCTRTYSKPNPAYGGLCLR